MDWHLRSIIYSTRQGHEIEANQARLDVEDLEIPESLDLIAITQNETERIASQVSMK